MHNYTNRPINFKTFDPPPKFQTHDLIRRIPVQCSINLGSFYDARRDQFVDDIHVPTNLYIKPKVSIPIYCKILKGNAIATPELCNEIGLDDNLWLSFALEMTSADSLVSSVQATLNFDEQTRLLHYEYVNEDVFIKEPTYQINDAIVDAVVGKPITHVVTGVRVGIHVIALFQIPTHDEKGTDRELDKISQQVTKNNFKVAQSDKRFMNGLVLTKIFTNVRDLSGCITLRDLWEGIAQTKNLKAVHHPMLCLLSPVQKFYPSFKRHQTLYVSIPKHELLTLKQYVLPLWLKMEQLKAFDSDDKEDSFLTYFELELQNIQREIQKCEQLYSNELAEIRELVFEYRSGTLKHNAFTEMVSNAMDSSLETTIDYCYERVRFLKEKLKFIHKLSSRHIKYFNMQNYSLRRSDDLNEALQKISKSDKELLVLCSSDSINKEDAPRANELYNEWMKSRETNPPRKLAYADFSYETSFRLPKGQIILLNSSNNYDTQSNSIKMKKSPAADAIRSLNDQVGSVTERGNTSKLGFESDREGTSSTANELFQIERTRQLHKSPKQSTAEALTKSSINILPSKQTFIGDRPHSKEFQKNIKNYASSDISSSQLDMSAQRRMRSSSADAENPTENVINSSPTYRSSSRSSRNSANVQKSLDQAVTESQTLPNNQNHENINSNVSQSMVTPTSRASSQRRVEAINARDGSGTVTSSNQQQKPSKNSELEIPINSQVDDLNASPTALRATPVSRQTTDIDHEHADKRVNLPRSRNPSAKTNLPNSHNLADDQKLSDANLITESNIRKELMALLRPASSKSTATKYINVLLLGESGVGKSTFINALVTYLKFQSFSEAYASEPVALLPVSFLMTMNRDFEKKMVAYGESDPNEDHLHPGQSVTQQCRSYVFSVNTTTKLRLIDTPGMGDMRGFAQDDFNLEHIISYINNLSHLNAICILLKPNESKLDVVLRSYFERLLNFLGERARQNIVFCFTNTRLTFYAPGDTAPLLKTMIASSSISNIPFETSNTFCFDNESFRYMVALQNGITFEEFEKAEYERSWVSSVNESARLLKYVSEETLKPYTEREWRSIEHAKRKIDQMIRPMIETLRNFFRNIILSERDEVNGLIRFYSTELRPSSAVLFSCERTRRQIGDFSILQDDRTRAAKAREKCACDEESHNRVDYCLEYEIFSGNIEDYLLKVTSIAQVLKSKIIQIGQFFAEANKLSKQTDPILSFLEQVIFEEQLLSEADSETLNGRLCLMLDNFKNEYNHAKTDINLMSEHVDLSNVYEAIETVSNIDDVKAQISIVEKNQLTLMKKYEKELVLPIN